MYHKCFRFRVRKFCHSNHRTARTPARIKPYPTGRLFSGGGAIPGTSYQATIASSLRDISQQDLAALPLHHARLSLPTNYQLTSSSCRECPLARPVGQTPIVAWHEVPAKASLERTVPQGTV